MRLFFLEFFLNFTLLALVCLFLNWYPQLDGFFFVMAALGGLAVGFVGRSCVDFFKTRHQVVKSQSFKSRTLKSSVSTGVSNSLLPSNSGSVSAGEMLTGERNPEAQRINDVRDVPFDSPITHLDFVDSAVPVAPVAADPSTLLLEPNLGPFVFYNKAPLQKGQSQLQALDDLVVSLVPGFRHGLILSDLKLSSGDGSLFEYLFHGKNVEALYCRGIYERLDLIPDLGNSSAATLFTKKRFAGLVSDWLSHYDLIICHFDESNMPMVKRLIQEVYQWRRQETAWQEGTQDIRSRSVPNSVRS